MVGMVVFHCCYAVLSLTDFHADDDNYDDGGGDNDYDGIDNNINYNSIRSS